MSLVFGLDGGGTKTVLALADRTGAVAELHVGGVTDPLGDPDWAATLRGLMGRIGVVPEAIEAATFGLPCYGEIAAVSVAQEQEARALLGAAARVENDVRVAFDGALGGAGGVLVLSGTGSMAWASAGGASARQVRVGGWGEFFGDEGSAFWIGREALGEASRALDGRGAAHRLAEALLAAPGVGASGLLGWAHGLPNRRSGVAGLARLVSALAEDGDDDARAILLRAGDHLADHAVAAWRQVGCDRPLTWTTAGGVLDSRIVRARIAERLAAEPAPPRLPPIGGALLDAARRAGWDVGAAWIEPLGRALAARLPPLQP